MNERECFVIQRKQKDGSFLDWVNPMTRQVEYVSHAQAVFHMRRSADAVDFRIVRRIWSCHDLPVGSNL